MAYEQVFAHPPEPSPSSGTLVLFLDNLEVVAGKKHEPLIQPQAQAWLATYQGQKQTRLTVSTVQSK